MKKIQWGLAALFVLALALPAAAAEIAIKHNGGWVDIVHVTTEAEDTAGGYYQFGEMDNLCTRQALAEGCSKAQYETECAKGGTENCETFYARTAEGGKLWFMDKLIKFNLTHMVLSRGSDIETRGGDHWDSLSLAEKEAQCIAWGKAADCS